MTSALLPAIRRTLSQPAFVTVAIILLVAAVSLHATVEFMQLHFQKQRVELRRKLSEVPARVGPWVQVTTDAAIDPETEEVLGTKDYIFRSYLDTRSPAVTPLAVATFKDKDTREQDRLLAQIQAADRHAVIRAAVTYYTGMVDTVAHIPDRCYVADGYEPTQSNTVRWSAFEGRPGLGYATYINFEDVTPQRRAVKKNVAYFFHSNGEYVSDPIAVRKKLQDLTETHAYYAKVELLMVTDEQEQAAAKMDDFLKSLLPEVEKCLPDWNEVEAAKQKK